MLLTIMGPEILETGEEYRAFLELEGEEASMVQRGRGEE